MILAGISITRGQKRTCGTDEYVQSLFSENPAYRESLNAIEEQTIQFLKKSKSSDVTQKAAGMTGSVTIPVIVHVVYNKVQENVSDQQITDQINVLNKDFSATNADVANTPLVFQSLVANTGIQFCLASVDPNGKPTTGIRRVKTSKPSFSTNDAVKYTKKGGDDAWPSDKYLNIWLCNLGQGLLGYATFPGGPADRDGIVVLYASVPGGAAANYNKGRTATHEVGHWLNLRHIWGDANCGTDYVDDTPTQQTSNYACPQFPHVTCNNKGDMSMNYMDYTYDACMYMLSHDQSLRMNALFASGGARVPILSSGACGTTTVNRSNNSIEQPIDDGTPGALRLGNLLKIYPSNVYTQLTVETNQFSTAGTSLRIFNMMGQQVLTFRITQRSSLLNVSVLSKGVYLLKIGDGREQQTARFIKQ